MGSENLNFEELTEARRQAIAESVQPITIEQLQTLGEGLFPHVDHPWREKYFSFLKANAAAAFHHATTHDRIHILYCHAQNRGLWFVPGSGMGPLREKGLGILKAIVEAQP